HRGHTEPQQAGAAGPATRGRLDDGVDEGAESSDRRDCASRLEGAGMRVLRLRQQEVSDGERSDDDRNVDEEHRAPREVLEKEAAGDGADRGPAAGESGPDGGGRA